MHRPRGRFTLNNLARGLRQTGWPDVFIEMWLTETLKRHPQPGLSRPFMINIYEDGRVFIETPNGDLDGDLIAITTNPVASPEREPPTPPPTIDDRVVAWGADLLERDRQPAKELYERMSALPHWPKGKEFRWRRFRTVLYGKMWKLAFPDEKLKPGPLGRR
jgi:hypothetical protein